MTIFGLFRKQKSAPTARERLQLLLSHERSWAGQSDLVAILREEILSCPGKGLIRRLQGKILFCCMRMYYKEMGTGNALSKKHDNFKGEISRGYQM